MTESLSVIPTSIFHLFKILLMNPYIFYEVQASLEVKSSGTISGKIISIPSSSSSSSSSSSPSSSHLWVCFERRESLFLRKARARHVFLLMLVSLYYSHILFSIISQRTRTILWSVCSRVWIKQTLIDFIGWVPWPTRALKTPQFCRTLLGVWNWKSLDRIC